MTRHALAFEFRRLRRAGRVTLGGRRPAVRLSPHWRAASAPARRGPGPAHAQFLGIQLQRGELAAPDRAGVDHVHAVADEQAQRRPVAADDLQVAIDAAGHPYHGYRPAGCVPGAPFSSNAMRPRGVQ